MNKVNKLIVSGVIAGSTLVGAAVGASTLAPANAATSTDTAAATAPSSNSGPHVANGITETPLTGTDLEKATAAALAAVPGATVERAETDADGAKYEVHVTKSDGTEATVKLDDSFNVTATETGRGAGGSHRGNDNDADNSSNSSSTGA